MNFNDRQVIKTESELKIDAALGRYEEKFGKPFVFDIGFSMSVEETLSAIDACIRENKPQTMPEYEKGVLY